MHEEQVLGARTSIAKSPRCPGARGGSIAAALDCIWKMAAVGEELVVGGAGTSFAASFRGPGAGRKSIAAALIFEMDTTNNSFIEALLSPCR